MLVRKALIGVVLAASVAATGLAAYQSETHKRLVQASRKAEMFKKGPAAPAEALQRQLAATPLQPDLLYGLIAARAADRKAQQLTVPESRVLASLGWRSNVAQVALLQDGLARLDEHATLNRLDGLLRRGKQTDQLVALLVHIEQTGSRARAELVDMLKDKPAWRRAFLIAPGASSNAKALIARDETLKAMFAARLKPTREEVAPIVNGLDSVGEVARAEALWRQFQGIGKVAPVPFDPHFVGMAADPSDGQYRAMVFEWNGSQGAGYSARANPIGNNSASLFLRWDGRGAPIFLRQKLITSPGELQIIVKGPLVDRAGLQSIGFVLYCGNKANFFDRLTQLDGGNLAFASSEPNGCRNPELRVVGLAEDSLRPVEIEFSTIRVTRAAAAKPDII